MTNDGSSDGRDALLEGFRQDGADLDTVLEALKGSSIGYFEIIREGAAFLKDLTLTETPDDPAEIQNLSEEEVIFATYRANFFEKLRMPVLDDAQLQHLLQRAHEIWGEHPTEPVGRWVDWCLWMHLHRRRNGVAITEVIAGTKTVEDMKTAWVERHKARDERRRLQKVDNYDRYETPADVPPSIRQLIMSPFIEDPDIVESPEQVAPESQENL